MTRDNADRLAMFAGYRVEVRRLALNMPQVEQYDPPPNPTKFTDSRAEGYVAQFGESCWELDALNPRVIAKLIRDELEAIRDPGIWQESLDEQERGRERLGELLDQVDDTE